jgi:hypothetical protein
MILSTIICFYILCVTTIFGIIFNDIVNKILFNNKAELKNIDLDLISLTGFCFLIIILSYTSIFYKIGLEVHVFIVLISGIYLSCCFKKCKNVALKNIKSFIRKPLLNKWAFSLIAIIVIFYAVAPINNIDTGYYHAQIIQWIENYKVIPGLGNINPVFGYNQSIYLPSALFSFSFLKTEPVHLINTYLFLLLMMRLLHLILNVGRYKVICLYLLGYFLFTHYNAVSSCGTDLPSFIFCTYIFLLFVNNDLATFNYNIFFIFLFTICVLTIKLSSIPIVVILVASFYYAWKMIKPRQIIFLSLFCVVFFSPWVARNVILSGYVLYPFPSLDIVEADWKIPKKDVRVQKNFIKSWAIMPFDTWKEFFPSSENGNLEMSLLEWEELVNNKYYNLTFKEKAKTFLNRHLKKGLGQSHIAIIIFSFFPFSTILLLPFLVHNFNLIEKHRKILLTWMTFYLAIIFITIFSPSYRFGSMYLHITLILGVYMFFQLINKKKVFLSLINTTNKQIKKWLISALALYTIFLIAINFFHVKTIGVFQYPYSKVKTVTIKNSNIDIRVPVNLLCWNEPIPCITIIGDANNFQLRTNKIEDGFKPKSK